jgi:membrane protease YdiL (CAAX protease family)
MISKSLLLDVEAIWKHAGPISLMLALIVATACLHLSRQTWMDLGLRRWGNMKRLVLRTLIALVITIAVGILAQLTVATVIGAPNEAAQVIDARYQARFEDLPGNLSVYLFWLAVAWIIGGFTEEMLFRGVLFERLEKLMGGAGFAVSLAIILQAILFGQQHYYYQGVPGWVANGLIAAVSGFLYVKFDRDLWPFILSHGLSNTIGLTLLYLG